MKLKPRFKDVHVKVSFPYHSELEIRRALLGFLEENKVRINDSKFNSLVKETLKKNPKKLISLERKVIEIGRTKEVKNAFKDMSRSNMHNTISLKN